MKHSAIKARHASDFQTVKPETATMLPAANDPSVRPASTPPMGAPRAASLRPIRKARRTLEQVIEGLPNEYEEAAYALARINANDLKNARIVNSVSPETIPHILAKRPDLEKYVRKAVS